MSEKMYPYPKKMFPTKEDILYNIEEGIIPKAVGEELIKQIESLPNPKESNPKIQVPRGQCKGFAGLNCRYEFAEIKVDEDDK